MPGVGAAQDLLLSCSFGVGENSEKENSYLLTKPLATMAAVHLLKNCSSSTYSSLLTPSFPPFCSSQAAASWHKQTPFFSQPHANSSPWAHLQRGLGRNPHDCLCADAAEWGKGEWNSSFTEGGKECEWEEEKPVEGEA